MARAWPVKMLACGRKPVAVTLVRIIHLHSNAVLVDICFRHATRLSASCMAQQNGERCLLCGIESDRSLRGGHLSIPEKEKNEKITLLYTPELSNETSFVQLDIS